MLKKVRVILFMATMLCGFSTFAADMKIGVIDLHQIVAQASEVKKIKQDLEKKFKPRQSKLMAEQKSVRENIDKLKRDSSVMSQGQKKSLQDKIIQAQAELERSGQAYQQELNEAQNQAMQAFFEKVKKTVDSVAKSEKYSLVMQKESVPYVAAQYDITKKILSKLN